ncbi:DUF4432 family protein [Thioclava sp. BHET1]|nr:DUF4432 family protein [Thioclava sp. BHET1]
MITLFGESRAREDWDALWGDLSAVASIREFREMNGAHDGQRVLRVETGGGLSVELLPDRLCDIGQVWLAGRPLGWAGPLGASDPARARGNQTLYGLMTTCGFDHIRKPETAKGHAYPQHGSMMLQPARILRAALCDADRVIRIEAEAVLFNLETGGMRLSRVIELPVGGTSIEVRDRVQVLVHAQPVMAMYHCNFGPPLAGPDARLELGGQDITAESLGVADVTTRPVAQTGERAQVVLSAPAGPRVTVAYDTTTLPVLQTLRNPTPGINLTCIEPASHERLNRADLETRGLLEPVPAGEARAFQLTLKFEM